MKLREIFRFEVFYQARRVSTWLYPAILAGVAFLMMGDHVSNARGGEYFLNAPLHIAALIVFLPTSLLWLLVTAAVSGDAATRDVLTRMHPLTYTLPVSKADYLGGRFLAAFVINATVLLALPAGALVAVLRLAPGLDAEIVGPFRGAAYLTAYSFIALPNAFIATVIQFSSATLLRRPMASYLASVLLLIAAVVVCGALLAEGLGLWELAKVMDPIGVVIVGELSNVWTTNDKNSRLIGLEGSLLANRLIWLGLALGLLAFTHLRFRFSHHATTTWWSRIARRRAVHSPKPASIDAMKSNPIAVPQVWPTFSVTTRAQQTLAIALTSFGKIVKSRGGLVLLAVTVALVVLTVLGSMEHLGVPLLPKTEQVLAILMTPQAQLGHWTIIPLLIIFWAGELVWRERDAGLSEIVDVAPVPEWILFLGRFLGLALALVVWLALLTATGMLMQVSLGYYAIEMGLYLQILFGLQLADYLLLALLALVVHVLLNQKHVANLMALVLFTFTSGLHAALRIEHNLLIYGSDPGWSYTEMGGFGPSLGPWLWFKLYWAAWALLLAVVARLFWVRGRDAGLGVRLRLARRRFARATAGVAAAAVGLILIFGGFIFYNTNVLNAYETATDQAERTAEYQRRYERYASVPQPRLTGVNLHVEIYPKRRAAEIRGTYRLVNNSAVAMDAIHVATVQEIETRTLAFDRPATQVLADTDFGYRIYDLEESLQPGDSLQLNFDVHYKLRGFRNSGADTSVVANGSYFKNGDWLPTIGYRANSGRNDAGNLQTHGLRTLPSKYDTEARQNTVVTERVTFEAVMGTDEDQVAVAPGALRRTWTEGGRRYYHYATDGPIDNEYAFFSAEYAVRETLWKDVAIRIYHHPEHTANLDRMTRSVRASLEYYTEQFGPYPYNHLSLVEHPGREFGMQANASLIGYDEGFSSLYPEDNPRSPDVPFSVVAHEVAHQWWGTQLAPARVPGAGLLSESLAEYSAYQVVKKTYGKEHLRRVILGALRAEEETPRRRAAGPLLRATDGFLAYRKGPLAMYALGEYIGEERVNEALRRLLEKHGSGTPPLPTSIDLYRELQAVTPDSLQYLLHDLFEVNTFWELETEGATAVQTRGGTWQVTLNVRARKVVVDEAGVETEVPMAEPVQVGVFGPTKEDGEALSEPLSVQMHRIRSGVQTITVTVPHKPHLAGIDPYHLLDWEEGDDDDTIAEVGIER